MDRYVDKLSLETAVWVTTDWSTFQFILRNLKWN